MFSSRNKKDNSQNYPQNSHFIWSLDTKYYVQVILAPFEAKIWKRRCNSTLTESSSVS